MAVARAPRCGPLLLVGLAGSGLSSALYAYGLHYTTASHSGLIYTLTPLLVFGLSHVLGYLRLDRRRPSVWGSGWRARR